MALASDLCWMAPHLAQTATIKRKCRTMDRWHENYKMTLARRRLVLAPLGVTYLRACVVVSQIQILQWFLDAPLSLPSQSVMH